MKSEEVVVNNLFSKDLDPSWISKFQEFKVRNFPKSLTFNLKFLSIVANHSGTKLIPLLISHKQALIGFYPIFVSRSFFLTSLFGSPPGIFLPFMVPKLELKAYSQRMKIMLQIEILEKINFFFSKLFKSKIDIFNFYSQESDVRPYLWNNYEVVPRYTYRINLSSNSEVFKPNFSRSARNVINIIRRDKSCKIEKNGDSIILKKINSMVQKRYDEQGIKYSMKTGFLDEIFLNFPESMQIFYLIKNDEFDTGMLFLEDDTTLYHWVGGTASKGQVKGATEFLHLSAMEYAQEKGLIYYDFSGANNKNLSLFKSKFNPQLKQYWQVSQRNFKGHLASKLYMMSKGL